MVEVIPTSSKLVGEVQLSRLRDTLVIFFNLRRGNLVDESMPIANQQCTYEAYGCVVSPQKTLEKEETIIAASQVLMSEAPLINARTQRSSSCSSVAITSFRSSKEESLRLIAAAIEPMKQTKPPKSILYRYCDAVLNFFQLIPLRKGRIPPISFFITYGIGMPVSVIQEQCKESCNASHGVVLKTNG